MPMAGAEIKEVVVVAKEEEGETSRPARSAVPTPDPNQFMRGRSPRRVSFEDEVVSKTRRRRPSPLVAPPRPTEHRIALRKCSAAGLRALQLASLRCYRARREWSRVVKREMGLLVSESSPSSGSRARGDGVVRPTRGNAKAYAVQPTLQQRRHAEILERYKEHQRTKEMPTAWCAALLARGRAPLELLEPPNPQPPSLTPRTWQVGRAARVPLRFPAGPHALHRCFVSNFSTALGGQYVAPLASAAHPARSDLAGV